MTLSKEWLDCKLSDCERYHHAHQAPINVKELRDVIRELLALRERTEPVCPKCQGTGLADSGGFQPWGEPIEVDCDCRAAMLKQPIQHTTLREGLNALRELGAVDAEKIFAEREALNDEPAAGHAWIACADRMPEEGGRYWCYVEEQNSLGKSHYQWNCSWNGDEWGGEALSGHVTHWQPLPAAPGKEG